MKHSNDYSRFENIGSDDEQPCAAPLRAERTFGARSSASAPFGGANLTPEAAADLTRELESHLGSLSLADARAAAAQAQQQLASLPAPTSRKKKKKGKATSSNNASQVEAEIARLRKEQADAMAALTAARDAANIAKRGLDESRAELETAERQRTEHGQRVDAAAEGLSEELKQSAGFEDASRRAAQGELPTSVLDTMLASASRDGSNPAAVGAARAALHSVSNARQTAAPATREPDTRPVRLSAHLVEIEFSHKGSPVAVIEATYEFTDDAAGTDSDYITLHRADASGSPRGEFLEFEVRGAQNARESERARIHLFVVQNEADRAPLRLFLHSICPTRRYARMPCAFG